MSFHQASYEWVLVWKEMIHVLIVAFLLSFYQITLQVLLSSRDKQSTIYHTLKEQYPVTAHALHFDFWTGCPEFKTAREQR